MEKKEVVLLLKLHDDKAKKKAIKAVAKLPGVDSISVDSISVDMKEKKLTVIGDVDPVAVLSRLRKLCRRTDILMVGSAKEAEKKDENPYTCVIC